MTSGWTGKRLLSWGGSRFLLCRMRGIGCAVRTCGIGNGGATREKQTLPKSGILEAVHETASDLHRLGFIDKPKQQKLDALCMEPIPPYDSERIRALREHLKLSQMVLASVLNTALSRCGNGRLVRSSRAGLRSSC